MKKAEAERRAVVLLAQGQQEAAILEAEGRKQALIARQKPKAKSFKERDWDAHRQWKRRPRRSGKDPGARFGGGGKNRGAGPGARQSYEAQGLAEATAIKEKAAAWREFNDAARLQTILEKLPSIIEATAPALKAMSEPLGNIDKIVMIDHGGGDSNGRGSGGLNRFAQTGPTMIYGLLQQLRPSDSTCRRFSNNWRFLRIRSRGKLRPMRERLRLRKIVLQKQLSDWNWPQPALGIRREPFSSWFRYDRSK